MVAALDHALGRRAASARRPCCRAASAAPPRRSSGSRAPPGRPDRRRRLPARHGALRPRSSAARSAGSRDWHARRRRLRHRERPDHRQQRDVGNRRPGAARDRPARSSRFDVDDAQRAARRSCPGSRSATVRKFYPDTLASRSSSASRSRSGSATARCFVIDATGDRDRPAGGGALRQACPSWSAAAPTRRRRRSSPICSPSRAIAAQMRAAVLVADRRWDLHLENGVTVKLPEKDARRRRSRQLVRLDAEQQLLVARRHRRSICACPTASPCACRKAGRSRRSRRDGAEGGAKSQGRARERHRRPQPSGVSRVKPLSSRALVDRQRSRRRLDQDLLHDRAAEAARRRGAAPAHALGRGARLRLDPLARHQVRRRRRPRGGGAGDPPRRRRRRAHGRGDRRQPHRQSLLRPAEERDLLRQRARRRAGRREADIQRVLAAGGAHSVSDGRMVLHALPIGYSLDGNRGIARSDRHARRDARRRHARRHRRRGAARAISSSPSTAATSRSRRSSRRPMRPGLAALVDDEAELGVACIDMGGGTTTLVGLPRGRVRPCRRDRRRRPPCHARHRARAVDQPRRCRAHQGAARLGAAVDLRRAATS